MPTPTDADKILSALRKMASASELSDDGREAAEASRQGILMFMRGNVPDGKTDTVAGRLKLELDTLAKDVSANTDWVFIIDEVTVDDGDLELDFTIEG